MLLTAIIVFSFVSALPAFAADELEISLSTVPENLSGEGKVTLKVNLNNKGDVLSDIVIKRGDKTLGKIASLASGANMTSSIPDFEVSNKDFGKEIEITIEYKHNGEAKSKKAQLLIRKGEAAATAELKVSSENTKLSAGSTEKIRFTVKNTGNVALLNCKITDPAIDGGNNLAGAPFAVEAGKSIDIEYDLKIDKAVTIGASLSYEADGSAGSLEFPKYQLELLDSALVLTAEPENISAAYEEEVAVKLTLTNAGGQQMSDIAVYDYRQNKITLPKDTLMPGESITAEHKFTAEQGGDYRYSGKCYDPAGLSSTFESNVLKLAVEGGEVDPAVPLELTIFTDKTTIEKPGKLTFVLNIVNATTSAFQDIVISEKTLGQIESLDELPGETKAKISRDLDIRGTSTLEFYMTAISPEGYKVEFTSAPLCITVTGGEDFMGFLRNLTSGSTILLVIGGVIAAIVVVLIIVLICLNNAEKKQRKAESEQRTQERNEREQNTAEVSRRTARPSRRRQDRDNVSYDNTAYELNSIVEETKETEIEAPTSIEEAPLPEMGWGSGYGFEAEPVKEETTNAEIPAAETSAIEEEPASDASAVSYKDIDLEVKKFNEGLEQRLNATVKAEEEAHAAQAEEAPEEKPFDYNAYASEYDDDLFTEEENAAKAEIERMIAEETAKMEAARRAVAEAENARKMAEAEAARLAAARKAAEEAAAARREAARREAAARAAEEAARREAAARAAEEAARREAAARAAEEAAGRKAAEEEIAALGRRSMAEVKPEAPKTGVKRGSSRRLG